jgi:hypothetical protein
MKYRRFGFLALAALAACSLAACSRGQDQEPTAADPVSEQPK